MKILRTLTTSTIEFGFSLVERHVTITCNVL